MAEPHARHVRRKSYVLGALALCGCATPPAGIRWPTQLAPENADLFTHNEVVVDAPCTSVWSILIDAAKWPEWYPNASNVQVSSGSNGRLTESSAFSWTTFGIPVQSRVQEFAAPSRLAWYGSAQHLSAYHAWLLLPVQASCRVITEETDNGPAAIALRAGKPEAIHDGHSTWLAQLKRVSELRTK